MTRSLDEKRAIFEAFNVGMVINFWSKLDSDMSEVPVPYLYIPTPRSQMMLAESNVILARYVAAWLKNTESSVLIMCEAGKTRSVFFCILLMGAYQNISLLKALPMVTKVAKNHALKQFMLDYVAQNSDIFTRFR